MATGAGDRRVNNTVTHVIASERMLGLLKTEAPGGHRGRFSVAGVAPGFSMAIMPIVGGRRRRETGTGTGGEGEGRGLVTVGAAADGQWRSTASEMAGLVEGSTHG